MALRKLAAALAAFGALAASSQALQAFDFERGAHLRPHQKRSAPTIVYGGASSVFHIRGVGTYVFSSAASSLGLHIIPAPTRKAKIIDVADEPDSCSYENGVCVIRGSN